MADPASGLSFQVEVLTLRHLGDVWLLRLQGLSGPRAGFQLMLTGPQPRRFMAGERLTLCLDLRLVHIMPIKTGAGTLAPAP
jgi:hypothetical protein